MANKAATPFEMPKFDMTQFTMPKFAQAPFAQANVDAYVAMAKANFDTAVKVQTIMADAAQAIGKVQYAYAEEAMKNAQAAFKPETAKKKPEEFVADAKAAAEKAFAVAKQEADLAIKAQKEVAELVTARLHDNFENVKSLAA